MRKRTLFRRRAAWIAALMIASSPQLFAAGKTWNTNDGSWSTLLEDAGNWDVPGAPTDVNSSAGDVNFAVTANSSNAAVDVDVSGAVFARLFKVGPGKTVTLNLKAGASISSSTADT